MKKIKEMSLNLSIEEIREKKDLLDWSVLSRFINFNKDLILEFKKYIKFDNNLILNNKINKDIFNDFNFLKDVVKYFDNNFVDDYIIDNNYLSKDEKIELINRLDFKKLEKGIIEYNIDFGDIEDVINDLENGISEDELKDFYISNL